jgi:hypothetical protein
MFREINSTNSKQKSCMLLPNQEKASHLPFIRLRIGQKRRHFDLFFEMCNFIVFFDFIELKYIGIYTKIVSLSFFVQLL